MIQEKPKTRQIVGPSISMSITGQVPPNAKPSVGNGLVSFDKIKPFLSDKPLRRPNRTRPIE